MELIWPVRKTAVAPAISSEEMMFQQKNGECMVVDDVQDVPHSLEPGVECAKIQNLEEGVGAKEKK